MKLIFLALLMTFSVTAHADNYGYAKFFLGTVDTFQENQDTQYGVEYEFAKGLTRFGFKPSIGLIRTRAESHYIHASINRTSKFTDAAAGLALTFSAGPGVYVHGGGDDTDLGSWFELRTSAGLVWLFADNTRVGLHLSHLSNASVSETNPGTELITLTYELPF